MTNADIMELLAKPSSNLTLKQRLMNDYNVKNGSIKKRKNKTYKNKYNKRK